MDPNIKAVGQAKIKIDAAGTINAPQLAGSVEMTGGRFIMRDPRIAADNMNIKLNLATNRIDIKELNGTVNGGSMTASGNVGYSGGTLNHFNITTTLRDFFINFPEGLKSSSDADLTISSQNDSIVVGGTIHVQDSSYRESIEVLGPAINSLKSQQIIEERELSPLLNRVRFNVGLQTEAPLLVQNNVAKIEASTNNLRIVGTPKNPSLIGRIQLGEGGEIVLNGRTYYITRGIITLSNQTQLDRWKDLPTR
jgi:hypothetical protein